MKCASLISHIQSQNDMKWWWYQMCFTNISASKSKWRYWWWYEMRLRQYWPISHDQSQNDIKYASDNIPSQMMLFRQYSPTLEAEKGFEPVVGHLFPTGCHCRHCCHHQIWYLQSDFVYNLIKFQFCHHCATLCLLGWDGRGEQLKWWWFVGCFVLDMTWWCHLWMLWYVDMALSWYLLPWYSLSWYTFSWYTWVLSTQFRRWSREDELCSGWEAIFVRWTLYLSLLLLLYSNRYKLINPTTRIPNSSHVLHVRPSQKPSSADNSETESGTIDPLVSKRPEKNR